MERSIRFSKAIEGFNLARRADQLSHHTLSDYNTSFRKLGRWFGDLDPALDEITADDVREFFEALGRRTVHPRGCAPRPARKLSRKTILNVHTGLSSLWTWALAEGYVDENVVRRVKMDKPPAPIIEPLSREDVELLLDACAYTREYERPGKAACRNARLTAERDRLIITFLLDTGVRVSELCDLEIGHIDLRNRRVRVLGKGDKWRVVPIGKRLAKATWRYLTARPDAEPGEPFIVDQSGEYGLSRYAVRRVLKRLGDKAGVSNVYPHRFRHTFSINYLRNGGQELALMRTLGHTTMEMTSRYAKIAQADIERNHKDASPVDNWKL